MAVALCLAYKVYRSVLAVTFNVCLHMGTCAHSICDLSVRKAQKRSFIELTAFNWLTYTTA